MGASLWGIWHTIEVLNSLITTSNLYSVNCFFKHCKFSTPVIPSVSSGKTSHCNFLQKSPWVKYWTKIFIFCWAKLPWIQSTEILLLEKKFFTALAGWHVLLVCKLLGLHYLKWKFRRFSSEVLSILISWRSV